MYRQDKTNQIMGYGNNNNNKNHKVKANKKAARKQQAAEEMRALRGSQSSNGSSSGASHTRSPAQKLASRGQEPSIDTPCRQIAQLKLRQGSASKTSITATTTTSKTTKNPRTKLLGSKSLSQLIPKNLFARRNSAGGSGCATIGTTGKQHSGTSVTNRNKFLVAATTNGSFQPDPMERSGSEYPSGELSSTGAAHSASMIGLPRQSTSNSLGYHSDICESLTPTTLSPIVASQNQTIRNVVASTPTLRLRGSKISCNTERATPKRSHTDTVAAATKTTATNGDEEGKTKEKKFAPFKSTALVLRDVKNSIGLRMKARHESRAFAKLTNETTSPPTKLYSPFNIYTPDGRTRVEEMKSRRKLNLSNNNNNNDNDNKQHDITGDSGNCSMSSSMNNEQAARTPKSRVALQHKKHMMQANKFAFDSPAGRLRETVKDVEQFQQCIEDISKAIRARNQLI